MQLWNYLTGATFGTAFRCSILRDDSNLSLSLSVQGMRVLSIFPNSPAEAAGLVPNKAVSAEAVD